MHRRTVRPPAVAAFATAALVVIGSLIASPASAEVRSAGVLPADVPTGDAAAVETVPYDVDTSNQAGWWRPLDVVGGVTYFAFNAPASTAARHEVHLAARSASGTWTKGCLRVSAGGACATFVDDNGHNQPSIVVDGAGTIHAFVSMHNEQWNFFRSTVAGDITSLIDATSEMPDLTGQFTYPVTARGADGDAWLLVRSGTDGQGRREGVLYHYDLAVGHWARETAIAAATGYSFYPDDLVVDEDGRVHVLWEWGPFPADPARHLGSYAVYDPATGALSDVAGAALTGPITPTTAGNVVWRPFGPGEAIGSYTPALQTAKLAVDGDSLRGIVYRFVEADETAYDVHVASWNGSGWVSEQLLDASAFGSGVSTIAGIDITTDGTTNRAYAVLNVQACGQNLSQVVRFERSTGATGWSTSTVGDAQRGQQRLRAETRPDGTDILYLTAPVSATSRGNLRHATIPRTGATPPNVPLEQIVATIRGDEGGTNVALGADVTVSSTLRADTGGALAVDGVCTDASRWISAANDATPTITVDWHTATALESVRVKSGYAGGDPASSVLRDFTIEVRTASGWVEVGRFVNSSAGTVTAPINGLVADQVRLVITRPSTSATNVARVFEIEAIAASG